MMWKRIMLSAADESLYNWRLALGEVDVEAFRSRFLDPIPGYTSVVRCPESGNCDQTECWGLEIKDLSKGTTACCPHLYTGPKIPMSQNELVRYSLSYPRFHAELCRLLGLKPSKYPVDAYFGELGTYRRGASCLLRVYISYFHVEKLLTTKIRELLADPKAVFALLVYDESVLPGAVAAELERRGCLCLFMPDLFSLQRDASLMPKAKPEQLFKAYREPRNDFADHRYRCEAGVKWSDIHIKLLNEETITVWRRHEAAYAASFSDLGLANGKTKKPNRVFAFLKALLSAGKTLIPVPAKTEPDYEMLVQLKRDLKKALIAFFPDVEGGDPIVYDEATHSYRLLFNISGATGI